MTEETAAALQCSAAHLHLRTGSRRAIVAPASYWPQSHSTTGPQSAAHPEPDSRPGQRMLGGSVAGCRRLAAADSRACKLQNVGEKKGGLAPGAVALAVSPQIMAT